MAVFRKKRKNGTLSENWYYRFEINRKTYKGSTYLTDRKEAQVYEDCKKKELQDLLGKDENVSSSVKERSLLNFREKITAEIQGKSIKLEDVWDIFRRDAPVKMTKIPKEKGWTAKEGYWYDFLYFIQKRHPACTTMRDITPDIAEEYIGHVKANGKFKKYISYGSVNYKSKAVNLSASTINKYIDSLSQIFRILLKQAGMIGNPFYDVKRVKEKGAKRDVYEMKELEKIDLYLRNLKKSTLESEAERKFRIINEAVFIIGINTGLRKADICFLTWKNIRFEEKTLDVEVLKTGERVFIPMTRTLYDFFKEKQEYKVSEYVTPELAEMYRVNREGITHRFKMMLKDLNIETLKAQEGRSRKISCKDIHSLRHTFCYLHGVQGTPLVVVQSMVGHMDKKMTESYMMHQTEELKRDAIQKFSLKPFQPVFLDPMAEMKNQLIEMVRELDSKEELESLLNSFKKGIGRDNGISRRGF